MDNEILDDVGSKSVKTLYQTSGKFLFYTVLSILFTIIIAIGNLGLVITYYVIFLFFALSVLLNFFGLAYAINSFLKKEENTFSKYLFLICHIVVALFLLYLIVAVYNAYNHLQLYDFPSN